MKFVDVSTLGNPSLSKYPSIRKPTNYRFLFNVLQFLLDAILNDIRRMLSLL